MGWDILVGGGLVLLGIIVARRLSRERRIGYRQWQDRKGRHRP